MDFLGLRNLDIIEGTKELLYKNQGIEINLNKIDYNDKEVYKNIYWTGNTNSVFQVEGEGMKKFLMELKPDCIEDLIAGISLYRPGPMDDIPKFIESKKIPKSIKYDCPQLEPILKPTYGCIVYQEQVMRIARDLAGYTLGRSDILRRYMSKKKMDKIMKEKENFVYGNTQLGITGCINNGIPEPVSLKIFDRMVDFAKYAFNKSHAAAYAVVSFQTAYLKYYYPEEYMCNVLSNTSDNDKRALIISDCLRNNISIKAPSINNSDIEYTVSDNSILIGLGGIKSLAKGADEIVEERNKGDFKSFKDFIARVNLTSTAMENLILCGAFDEFTENRISLLNSMSQLNDVQKKIKEKQKKIVELEAEKDDEKKAKVLERTKTALEKYQMLYNSIGIINIPENFLYKMEKELEILGNYITGHPLDAYPNAKKLGVIEISELEESNSVTIYGMVDNLVYRYTKKDHKKIAFFDLVDYSGSIKVCCFAKEFEAFGKDIADKTVIKVSGQVKFNGNIKEMYIKKYENVERLQPSVIVSFKDIMTYTDILLPELLLYKEDDGYELYFFNEQLGELRKATFNVHKDILDINIDGVSVKKITK